MLMTPANELPGGSKVVKVTVAAEPSVKRYQATSAEPGAIAPGTKSPKIEGLPRSGSARRVNSGAVLSMSPAVKLSSGNCAAQLGAAGTDLVSSCSINRQRPRRRLPGRIRRDGLNVTPTMIASLSHALSRIRVHAVTVGTSHGSTWGRLDGGEVSAISH